MCGIIGLVSQDNFSSNEVINMLKRLEYRGYDSFGIVTNSGLFEKEVGEVKPVVENKCTQAVAHTRWATTGGVTKENAHPHSDCSGNIFLVHNGILENYLDFKKRLVGHKFVSETDTEVVAHYFEEKTKTKSVKESVLDFMNEAEGTFAIVLMIRGDKNLYAFKRGSPLSLGLLEGGNVLASDIYAFSDRTDKTIFFNEDEFAIVNESGYEFYRLDNGILNPVSKAITKVKWSGTEEKKNFDHYMIKEIYEEPEVAGRLVNSLQTEQMPELEKLKQMISSAKRTVFVASGTSYHAALLGVYFLNKAGIEAHAIIASEFRNFYLVDDKTLIIAVTQSGETMDVIEALHGMKSKGARIASLVNVPYSTIQRMSNVSINIEAGQEICVAATKSFVNQVIALTYLASLFGYEKDFSKIPEDIRNVLSEEEKIKRIAKSIAKSGDIYIIGRGYLYPVAREIALKIKEISYIHAEGMMGGELKHGTLALIEKGTPVIALIDNKPEIISNVMEVKARGGRIIAITNRDDDRFGEAIRISARNKLPFSIEAAVAGQLLAYHIAKEKGLPIDRPRNLAKCVSVK
ncbi:MAG: glutamine--fructose-6-phosphate transaminase (isomerizing) [Candidatus Aenigmarchaeota archaeon]|nr:glutamine--fructose-6-phosphate transaminase (isomerizing) [Candidatus Aenigmarchaeota archaeon]